MYRFPGWYILYALSFGWCAGVIVHVSEIQPSNLWWIICLILIAATFHVKSTVLVTFALVAGYSHAYLYHHIVFGPDERDARAYVFDTQAEEIRGVQGVIISKPLISGSSHEFHIEEEGTQRKIVVRMGVKKCTCDPEYGDVVEVTGTVSYGAEKYFKKRIFIELRAQTYKETGVDKSLWSQLVRTLYGMRVGMVERIDTLYSEPRSNLLSGLIIEGGASMPADLKKQFSIAGLSHIVALSGFNVAIVIEAVFFVLAMAQRKTRIFVGMGFIILFGIMTGLSSPIIRASIMSVIKVVGQLLYKRYHALRALIVSGMVMVWFNPLYLTEDISFQLSIAATLGLIAGNEIISSWLEKLPHWMCIGRGRIRETLSTTLSAQIFVTPLIAAYMGTFSVIAPLSNTLALPAVPFAMLFGFISLCVSYIPGIGMVMAGLMIFFADLLLRYLLLVAKFTSSLPFASIRIQLSLTVAIAVICLTGILLIYLHERRRRSMS
jgi:competence protein ComEC